MKTIILLALCSIVLGNKPRCTNEQILNCQGVEIDIYKINTDEECRSSERTLMCLKSLSEHCTAGGKDEPFESLEEAIQVEKDSIEFACPENNTRIDPPCIKDRQNIPKRCLARIETHEETTENRLVSDFKRYMNNKPPISYRDAYCSKVIFLRNCLMKEIGKCSKPLAKSTGNRFMYNLGLLEFPKGRSSKCWRLSPIKSFLSKMKETNAGSFWSK